MVVEARDLVYLQFVHLFINSFRPYVSNQYMMFETVRRTGGARHTVTLRQEGELRFPQNRPYLYESLLCRMKRTCKVCAVRLLSIAMKTFACSYVYKYKVMKPRCMGT